MSLISYQDLELTKLQRINLFMSGMGQVAIDLKTGAHLIALNGRTKHAPRYYLFIPPEGQEEEVKLENVTRLPEGNESWRFEGGKRLLVRAWSEEEAIQIANEKLAKVLAKRQNDDLPQAQSHPSI